MSFFVIKSAKQNSYRMDIFIATAIKSTYNIRIYFRNFASESDHAEKYPNQMRKCEVLI